MLATPEALAIVSSRAARCLAVSPWSREAGVSSWDTPISAMTRARSTARSRARRSACCPTWWTSAAPVAADRTALTSRKDAKRPGPRIALRMESVREAPVLSAPDATRRPPRGRTARVEPGCPGRSVDADAGQQRLLLLLELVEVDRAVLVLLLDGLDEADQVGSRQVALGGEDGGGVEVGVGGCALLALLPLGGGALLLLALSLHLAERAS